MAHDDPGHVYLRRFDAFDRVLHGLLMVSFLGLAATGLPLLFNDEVWARRLSRVLGGFDHAPHCRLRDAPGPRGAAAHRPA